MERTADPSWVKWHRCLEVYVFIMCAQKEKERRFEKLGAMFSMRLFSLYFLSICHFHIVKREAQYYH